MTIDLKTANRIIETGRRLASQRKLKPLTFCVLDEYGRIVAAARENRSNLLSFELAYGKAWGALGLGHSTRYLRDVLVKDRPDLAVTMEAASRGRFVTQYGGVLVRDADGELVGAVGVAGEVELTDEEIAVAALQECGLRADLT